jgi:hypothetical protein
MPVQDQLLDASIDEIDISTTTRKMIRHALVLGIILAGPACSVSAGAPVAQQAPDTKNSPATTDTLILRGLDKISGQPTDIVAPIGRQVAFATLRITARFCYTTPPSDPPETVAFLQIYDDRPGQPPRRIFSGWMYASRPDLNGLDHPIYDVWVIKCRMSMPSEAPAAVAAAQPTEVSSPDSTDNEAPVPLPEDAGK